MGIRPWKSMSNCMVVGDFRERSGSARLGKCAWAFVWQKETKGNTEKGNVRPLQLELRKAGKLRRALSGKRCRGWTKPSGFWEEKHFLPFKGIISNLVSLEHHQANQISWGRGSWLVTDKSSRVTSERKETVVIWCFECGMSHLHPWPEVELKFYYFVFPLIDRNKAQNTTFHIAIYLQNDFSLPRKQVASEIIIPWNIWAQSFHIPHPKACWKMHWGICIFSVYKSPGWLRRFSFQRVKILKVWKSHSEVFPTKMYQVFSPLVTSTSCASCVGHMFSRIFTVHIPSFWTYFCMPTRIISVSEVTETELAAFLPL